MSTEFPSPAAALALLRGRRTVSRFLPEPLPEPLVLDLLEAGRWAPNHRLTEPWRFLWIGPETRAALAPAFVAAAQRKLPAEAPDARRAEVERNAREKWESRPEVVAIAVREEGDALRREEDLASVHCAIQNIQLAAAAAGVGTQWSTSAILRDPEAHRILGLLPEERLVALLFLGRPAELGVGRRRPLEEVLRRLP